MAFDKITILLNNFVDVIIRGNFERTRLIKEMNLVFNYAFISGDIQRLCKVSTTIGNPRFKHELSTFYLRSGFKIIIENDQNLTMTEFNHISSFVIASEPFVRQLMAFGYDTLIIAGKKNFNGIEICLRDLTNLTNYMLK